jgi:hypothetical protein
MLTKREIVLLVIFLMLVAGGGYYVVFYRPYVEEVTTLRSNVERMEMQLSEAQTHALLYEALTNVRDSRLQEWADALNDIPQSFDRPDTLRRIQRIFYARVPEINISYSETQRLGDALWVSEVTIRFAASRATLMTILSDFAWDDTENRIVRYVIGPEDVELAQWGLLNITMTVEFLTREGESNVG